MHLSLLDIAVIVLYAVLLMVVAYYDRIGENGDIDTVRTRRTRTLPWWAVGTSLIAANISAEQIIGMSGSAYAFGLAIAGYEWMAALALLIAGKYFLPVFLKNDIRTMPEFLLHRFGKTTQVTMAAFWLAAYVFVNLTTILWLGATAVHVVTGLTLTASLVLLGLFAGNYALYAGLRAASLTDAVQVLMLVLGGLVIVVIALEKISGDSGISGLIGGVHVLTQRLPDHFHLILKPDNPFYKYAPGLAMVIGGMWVINISYWGFNQYIIQRALTARSIRDARKGVVLAALLKLLIPVLVVLPGIAAVQLVHPARPDEAYPLLMTTLPNGLMGFVFIALVAAIVSSMGSTLSSVATIFSRDLLRPLRPGCGERLETISGRFAAIAALLIAMAMAEPILGRTDQAFQYIQDFTGFLTPGVLAVFLMGLFWPRASQGGAMAAAIGSVALSTAFKLFLPVIPFVDRISIVFGLALALGGAGSMLQKPPATAPALAAGVDYSTGRLYTLASVTIVAFLAAVYVVWW